MWVLGKKHSFWKATEGCRESLLLSPRLKTGNIKEKLAEFGELELHSNSQPLLMK